jgi:signal peptidase I
MSDDDAAWRDGTGGAWMSGSGARDGFGSPPWDPADPVPDLEDTQAIPGLGSIGGPGEPPGRVGGAFGPGDGDRYGPPPGGNVGPGWAETNAWQQRAGYGDFGHDGSGRGGSSSGQAQGAFGAARDDFGAAGPASNSRDTAAGGSALGRAKTGAGPRAKHSKRRRSFWRELPVLIVVALVLALVIKSFVIQAFYIPSASMENTLEIGDRVLINKVVYHLRPIHRGDIIVFDGTGSWDFDDTPNSSNIFSKGISELEGIVGISHDTSIYIKRVIGLPGDHVMCCNATGQVTVNNVALSETSYLYPGNVPSTQPFNIVVPAGRLWVMGDHRSVSYDSRGHEGDPGGGTIPESGVLGRAFVIIWPPSRWGFLNIPATFEQPKLNASNAAAGGSAAALVAAMDNGTQIQAAGSALPLTLGFAGAIPLALLQRTARRRLKSRRSRLSFQLPRRSRARLRS